MNEAEYVFDGKLVCPDIRSLVHLDVVPLDLVVGTGEQESGLVSLPAHAENGSLDLRLRGLVNLSQLGSGTVVLMIDTENENRSVEACCSKHTEPNLLVAVTVDGSWGELQV